MGAQTTKPDFSVVTVCLNPGPDLLRTGESVLEQRDVSFEWLIKDGMSTDGTRNRDWSEAKVKFIACPDQGIFDAMNQALDSCAGEYVLFLNVGDVFCSPNALKQVARTIEENQSPEVVYTYYEEIAPGVIVKYPHRLTPRFLYRRSVCHQATFVRRDCFSRYGGFSTSFRIVADDELLARLILKQRVRAVRCPFASTRIEEWKWSARPENLQRWRDEREAIRQQHLTASQRFRARLLYLATFPVLRRKWIALSSASRAGRVYLGISNFLNSRL